MRKDQIFVLMLVVLLPLTGCFDGGGIGDADAQESSDSTTVVNNYYNNTTSQSSQERIWYSSGDVVNSHWNDGQDVRSGQQRCLEYGPSYDSNTGEYLGEECKEFGTPQSQSDWNGTSCAGELVQNSNWYWGPNCKIVATTIMTNSGEALILYEMHSISVSSVCGGVQSSVISQIGGHYGGEEFAIVPGSALSCEHEISFTQSYQESSSVSLNDMKIWSLVYAIQETVVV